MNKTFFYILIFLSASLALTAQNVPETYGARAAALGNAASTHSDAFSVFTNQAGLADIEQISAGVGIENRFLLTELNALVLSAAIPTRSGTFGIGVNYYGLEDYNTQRAVLAYGRKLFEDKLNIGAEFDFINLNIPEFGSKSAITFGLGLQYQLNDRIAAAAHIFNPFNLQTTDQEEDLLFSAFKFGFSYIPSEQVGIYLETVKSFHHPAGFNGGIEYSILEKLILRAGFSTVPSALIDGRFGTDLAYFTAGVGVNLNPLRIDIGNRFHPVLGHTPSLTISFNRQTTTKNEVPEEE